MKHWHMGLALLLGLVILWFFSPLSVVTGVIGCGIGYAIARSGQNRT
jgi:hypothetical protein